jgi:hypothetical protein
VSPGVRGRSAVWAVAILAAAWILVVGAMSRPAGGLAGTYSFLGADGREIEVTHRIDPSLDFPVPQRLDAAYIFNWDYERFGFPSEMPPSIIRWRGLLSAPEAGTYGFSVDARGEAALAIDGAALEVRPDATTERSLAPGLHAIAVEYRLTTGDARLILSWQPPGRPLRPVPERFLAPDQVSWQARSGRHLLAWLLGVAGVIVAAGLVLLGRRSPDGGAGRLLAAAARERTRLALAAVLLLAALLRFHDYALVPFHHETADEYQHAWEGWHLLHERTPAAWSTFPDRYPSSQTRDFRWFGDRYVLVRPYFDHPPLFSIPVGLLCSLAGARTFLDCTLPVMRVVPIFCSLVGLLLLFRLARAYGASERSALLACLVYATVPVIILGHRLVKAENLLALLFMGAVLAVAADASWSARRGAIVAGLFGALAIWTKATGVAVVVTVVILLAARRRWKDAAIAAGIAAGAVALYVLYASAYDFGIFLKVLEGQSTSKWVSLEAFHDLLGGKAVVKWFGRGTYLWLLLAAAMAAFGRARALLLPLVVYGTVLALTADHRVVYGWYRVPLYPFLCVAAGIYLEDMLRDADLFRTFPFAISAVAAALLYGLPEAAAQSRPVAWLFAAGAVLPFLPRLLQDGETERRIARAGAMILVAAFLLANAATVGRLLEVYSATRGLQ